MADAEPKLLTSVADGVARLTLNNPARHNAISVEMWQAMTEALDRFEADPSVRVLIVRGAGGKSFAAGADISQFDKQRQNAEQQAQFSAYSRTALQRFDTFAKPVIAMIEGYCIGGGVRLALAADIRIAADNAVFGIPAAKLGLGYSMDSVEKLVAVIGPAVTADLLFTARRIDATEAMRLGLVTRVVTADAIEDVVRTMAAAIAANAPLTIRAVKLAIRAATQDAATRDDAAVAAAIRACFDSRDYAEGRKAFAEKRLAKFEGL